MNETNNLKFQQTLFQTIIDNDPNGIFVKDLNHNYIIVNHQMETIFNLKKEQIIGKCDFDLMDKDMAQDCMNAEKEVLIGLTKSAKLEKMIVVDGEGRHYLIQKNIIHVENEKFILGVVMDITELKLTELKLKSQNTFLENILDSIPLPIYYKNTQSRFVKCNKSFLDFFEIDSIFDIVNKNFIPNCSAEFNILDKESDGELTKKGKIQTKFEFQFEFSSKENIDSIIYKSYYKSENLSGIIGVIVDVTQHKKFENILKEFNEQLERQVEFEVSERLKTKNLLNQIIEATFDAIIVIDDEEKVKIWNKAAEIIFGYTKVEIIGKVLHEHIMPKNLNKNFENGFKNFKQSGDGTIFGKILELEAVKKDGTSFPVEVAVSRMKIDNKWHAVGIVR
ncbi:MAG: PAS domain S-box protein, partial [Campylobacterales bacterium]|nr:PAS domain S-box protein [Campylobacterales bacterium]